MVLDACWTVAPQLSRPRLGEMGPISRSVGVFSSRMHESVSRFCQVPAWSGYGAWSNTAGVLVGAVLGPAVELISMFDAVAARRTSTGRG
jgi:hypothetical protein